MAVLEAELTGPDLQSGSRTQGLLATLLGDYWYGRTTYIPSAALVALLGEFDVSSQAARAALSRVSRSCGLEGTKQGRRTAYRMAPAWAWRTQARGRAIMEFTQLTPDAVPPWDGRWTVAVYSLPANCTDERRRMRRRLRTLGFAPLQDAVWISPNRLAREAAAALETIVSVDCFTVLEDANAVPGGSIDPAGLWALEEIAERYRAIVSDLRSSADQVRQGGVTPARALVMRTEAMEAWRIMYRLDPTLPPELLPAGWPGWQARRLFAEVYDGLGDLAELRVRQIVGQHSQDAAGAVRHDTVVHPRD